MAVQFKFTGDDKDVQRALERMEKQYNSLISTAKKGTNETKAMADAAKKAFEETRTPQERYIKRMEELNALVKKGAIDYDTYGRAAKKAAQEAGKIEKSGGGLASGALEAAKNFGIVAAAIGTVNAQLEKTNRLNAQANAAQMSVGDAQAKFMRNLGNATPADRQALVAQTMAMATRNKQSPAETFLATSEALSAGAAPSAALAAVNAAQQLVPERGALGERQTVAGSILDVAKLTGSGDMMANAGLIQAMGQAARVSSIEMTTKNLVPAMGSMQAIGGGTPQQNAAILAALTQVGDVTGATSGTAGIKLAAQLAEAFPEKDMQIFGEGGKVKGITPGTGMKSTLERLRYVQADKDRQAKFLGTATFEAQALGGIRGLVGGPGTPIGAALDENLKTMPTIDKAGAFAENIIKGFGSTAGGVIAGMGRTTEASKATLDLSDAEGMAYADEVRKRLGDITQRTHNVVSGPIARMGYDMRVGLFGTEPGEAFDAVTAPDRLHLQNKFDRGAASSKEGDLLTEIKKLREDNRQSLEELRRIRGNQRNRNPENHQE